MAKSKKKRSKPAPQTPIPKGWGEFLGVALLAIGALMFGGLFSYQFGDGTFMGPVGRIVAGALYAGFGMAGYLIALGVVGVGIKALTGQEMELRLGEGVGFTAATMAGCVLLHVTFPRYRVHGYTSGGLTGELLGEVSLGLFDAAGTYLIALTVMCIGLLASTPLEREHLLRTGRWMWSGTRATGSYLWSGIVAMATARDDEWEREPVDEDAEGELEDEALEDELEEAEDELEEAEEAEEPVEVEAPAKPKKRAAKAKAKSKGGPAKNTRRAPRKEVDEEPEPVEVEPAVDPDALDESASLEVDVAPPKKKKDKKKRAPKAAAASEELPEIVLTTEDDEDASEAAKAEAPAPKAAKGKKKAPPRPEELATREDDVAEEPEASEDEVEADDELEAEAEAEAKPKPKPGPRPVPAVTITERKREGAMPVTYLKDEYELPPIELFAAAEQTKAEVDKEFVFDQAERIVQALAHFKIKGKVTKIHPGPVITRYEFKPEAGTKVSKIQNLENDLAMALEAIRIRILAPIPGKSTVGLEVPNKQRETVYVQENLEDPGFKESDAKLPLVLGTDIVGSSVSIDLAKAPHLLVAGATGSGKSVGVNAMLCSLMYTRSPDDLRMILIDPKMLEFSIYRDIPHLLLPVITDAEKANLALRWAVNEMERRYAELSEARVRDIKGYNKKLPKLIEHWEGEKRALEEEARLASEAVREDGDEEAVLGSQLPGVSFDANGQSRMSFGGMELPPKPEKMPYIVIVIDEFADLMMVASKEVEANVARLAAKARAAGIHLIVATQRPSVDVITGTIKNNFPSRIAFQVTSDTDSRTILDQKGAKQLLGMGDMLYMDRGKEPRRVHGCFVSEQEIERVVDFAKKQAKPGYNLEITKAPDADEDEVQERPQDALYDKAVQIVAEAGKVSTSMLQRRLNVGYNRAAKIVESMEEEGVIGPPNGSKPREVYISAA